MSCAFLRPLVAPLTAASVGGAAQYDAVVDIATGILVENPFDTAVWFIKVRRPARGGAERAVCAVAGECAPPQARALTEKAWIDDSDMEEVGRPARAGPGRWWRT